MSKKINRYVIWAALLLSGNRPNIPFTRMAILREVKRRLQKLKQKRVADSLIHSSLDAMSRIGMLKPHKLTEFIVSEALFWNPKGQKGQKGNQTRLNQTRGNQTRKIIQAPKKFGPIKYRLRCAKNSNALLSIEIPAGFQLSSQDDTPSTSRGVAHTYATDNAIRVAALDLGNSASETSLSDTRTSNLKRHRMDDIDNEFKPSVKRARQINYSGPKVNAEKRKPKHVHFSQIDDVFMPECLGTALDSISTSKALRKKADYTQIPERMQHGSDDEGPSTSRVALNKLRSGELEVRRQHVVSFGRLTDIPNSEKEESMRSLGTALDAPDFNEPKCSHFSHMDGAGDNELGTAPENDAPLHALREPKNYKEIADDGTSISWVIPNMFVSEIPNPVPEESNHSASMDFDKPKFEPYKVSIPESSHNNIGPAPDSGASSNVLTKQMDYMEIVATIQPPTDVQGTSTSWVVPNMFASDKPNPVPEKSHEIAYLEIAAGLQPPTDGTTTSLVFDNMTDISDAVAELTNQIASLALEKRKFVPHSQLDEVSIPDSSHSNLETALNSSGSAIALGEQKDCKKIAAAMQPPTDDQGTCTSWVVPNMLASVLPNPVPEESNQIASLDIEKPKCVSHSQLDEVSIPDSSHSNLETALDRSGSAIALGEQKDCKKITAAMQPPTDDQGTSTSWVVPNMLASVLPTPVPKESNQIASLDIEKPKCVSYSQLDEVSIPDSSHSNLETAMDSCGSAMPLGEQKDCKKIAAAMQPPTDDQGTSTSWVVPNMLASVLPTPVPKESNQIAPLDFEKPECVSHSQLDEVSIPESSHSNLETALDLSGSAMPLGEQKDCKKIAAAMQPPTDDQGTCTSWVVPNMLASVLPTPVPKESNQIAPLDFEKPECVSHSQLDEVSIPESSHSNLETALDLSGSAMPLGEQKDCKKIAAAMQPPTDDQGTSTSWVVPNMLASVLPTPVPKESNQIASLDIEKPTCVPHSQLDEVSIPESSHSNLETALNSSGSAMPLGEQKDCKKIVAAMQPPTDDQGTCTSWVVPNMLASVLPTPVPKESNQIASLDIEKPKCVPHSQLDEVSIPESSHSNLETALNSSGSAMPLGEQKDCKKIVAAMQPPTDDQGTSTSWVVPNMLASVLPTPVPKESNQIASLDIEKPKCVSHSQLDEVSIPDSSHSSLETALDRSGSAIALGEQKDCKKITAAMQPPTDDQGTSTSWVVPNMLASVLPTPVPKESNQIASLDIEKPKCVPHSQLDEVSISESSHSNLETALNSSGSAMPLGEQKDCKKIVAAMQPPTDDQGTSTSWVVPNMLASVLPTPVPKESNQIASLDIEKPECVSHSQLDEVSITQASHNNLGLPSDIDDISIAWFAWLNYMEIPAGLKLKSNHEGTSSLLLVQNIFAADPPNPVAGESNQSAALDFGTPKYAHYSKMFEVPIPNPGTATESDAISNALMDYLDRASGLEPAKDYDGASTWQAVPNIAIQPASDHDGPSTSQVVDNVFASDAPNSVVEESKQRADASVLKRGMECLDCDESEPAQKRKNLMSENRLPNGQWWLDAQPGNQDTTHDVTPSTAEQSRSLPASNPPGLETSTQTPTFAVDSEADSDDSRPKTDDAKNTKHD